ncbi:ComF family protein [Paenibacillus sp. QZ-Y1]|uniref:ComF family protein n=1 Tax=Paenibacillus sp. QZ-Y1 TaxID=3414511 RepID=UPI003F7ACC3B
MTYVPVSDERLAERGFNQAEQLAAGLATACRLPIVDLLQRRINTTKQSFKTRGERIQTMQNAFAMQSGAVELMIDLYRTSELPKHRSRHHQLHSAGSYLSGVRNAFPLTSATNHPRITPLRLLLIDDIYTTGSTLDACGRVILNAGFSNGIPIEVYTLTLARS